jgi:ribulose-5-phosphate 4-epimerase/fuculose-1-phosphate aldolase
VSQFDEIKMAVWSAARALADKGIFKATEGNVSMRVPHHSFFAVTPSAVDYYKMEPEDICIVNFDGELIDGRKKPSIESGMHRAVYLERSDVHVVLHTHQVYASSLALVDKPIPALFDEQVRYLGRSVDIIPYGPSGTSFLTREVRRKIKNGNNAYILKNHGVLVLGGSFERALHNIELLEKCALTYILALSTGERVTKIPMLIREVAFAKLKSDEKRFAKDGASLNV